MRSGLVFALCAFGLLAACKKDDPAAVPPPPPPPPPPPATYTVGGTVTGLTDSVTLANNGGDARTVNAAGAFSFATPLATGAAYSVTVTSQPANQTCTVGSGSGTVASANIAGVSITCATNTFTVGGAVTGLAGSGLALQNNGGDNLARTTDGAFTFATPVASGGAYSVTVLTQPSAPAQTCTVTNHSGTVAANVTTVAVTCVTNAVVVGSAAIGPAGGTVNGFYGAQIIVPPGALPNTVTIGLTRDSSNSPAYAVPETDAVGATYELTPHGQAFSVPVTVRIPFDPAQVSNDAEPQIYKAETGGTFAALPTTVNGNFLEASVTSFSWVIPAGQATRPRMVYAVENASGALSLNSYRITGATGALGASTSSAPVGDYPLAAVSHPSGKFVFLTNAGSNTQNGIAPNSVATYRVSTVNGQLSNAAASSVATRAPVGYRPTMPVVHPSGKFLYVLNFGSVTNNSGGDIDKFTIDGATGALTLAGSAISGAGAQPMTIAFDRLGARAYVLYAGSSSTNTFSSKIVLYDVNLTTGEFSTPVSSTAACVLGGNPWSIALDPNNRSMHVVCLSTDELLSYSVNATTGALSPLGNSLSVLRRPASLAADSFGRFIFATKQDVLIPGNVLSYRMDNTSGALSFVNGLFSGCPGGACGGPTSIVADPQGNYVYAIDTTGGLTAFAVNATSGVLTSVASRTGAWVPATGGVGTPFRFAVSGASPVWQTRCTHNCALFGFLSSPGSGGGNPPTNPKPPSSHFLSVSIGPYFGSVSSTPAGIDYSPPTNANPLGRSDMSSSFPANSTVTLCATEPPQPAGAYDITWTGSCSGTGWCTNVTMNSDKYCNAGFSPVVGR